MMWLEHILQNPWKMSICENLSPFLGKTSHSIRITMTPSSCPASQCLFAAKKWQVSNVMSADFTRVGSSTEHIYSGLDYFVIISDHCKSCNSVSVAFINRKRLKGKN
jgi:hypothetical protein